MCGVLNLKSISIKKEYTKSLGSVMLALSSLPVTIENNIAYIISNRKTLSKLSGKTVKTVTRNLKSFSEANLIKLEYRLGKDGGYVIMLNPDLLDFSIRDNPLTNPTKEDISLINKIFPLSDKRKPKGIRRTKAEMESYRAQLVAQSDKERKLNNIVSNETLFGVNWTLFKKTGNATHNYKIWLTTKAYDNFVYTYETYYTNLYKTLLEQGVPAGKRRGMRTRKHNTNYTSLKDLWFGTPNWKTAEKIVKASDELNITPVAFISKVFERYNYTHMMTGKPAHIPMLNQVIDKNGYRYVVESIRNQKFLTKMRSGNLPIEFMKSLTLKHINFIFNALDKGINIYDIPDPIAENSYKKYYDLVSRNIKRLVDIDKYKAIDYYLKEQIAFANQTDTLRYSASDTIYYAMNKLKPIVEEELLENPDSIDPAIYMLETMGPDSDNNNLSGYKGYHAEALFSTYKEHTQDGFILRSVVQVEKQRENIDFTYQYLQEAISEVGDMIPVTNLGLLDRDRIKDKFDESREKEIG